tara:strand:- start:1123 stop:1878 length:756 start_codon:yes stop_codon:yes gene_type:complete
VQEDNVYKDIVVIVPARGGSKRIPKKNIKLISGWPMISWPLRELTKAFSSSQILISTDDQDIKTLVSKYNLSIPFNRPTSLSDDYTGTMAVAQHAFEWFESQGNTAKYVLIVYPTAVTLDLSDIRKGLDILEQDVHCDYVFSATSFPFPIQRAIYEESNQVKMFNPEHYSTRSQDLTPAFHDAGQFYLCRADVVRQGKNLTNACARIVKLKRKNVIDIDTPEDFDVADQLLRLKIKNKELAPFSFQTIKEE